MLIVTDVPQMTPDGFTLGRWPQHDPRNHRLKQYYPEVLEQPLTGRRLYQCAPGVDQGEIPKCTGTSTRHKLNAGPVMDKNPRPTDSEIYAGAQAYDEWDGSDYDGSSLLGVGRWMKAMGHWDAYAFTNDVQKVARFMLAGYGGPLLGIEWRRGMARPDANGFIHPTGALDGYHAIFACEVVWGGAPNEGHLWAGAPYFTLQQSWGDKWGIRGSYGFRRRNLAGFCRIDADKLAPLLTLERYGEAMTEVERRRRKAAA